MARFPALNPFGAGGPVSFTRESPAGVMTIDALMARQRELADRQSDLSSQVYPGQGTIPGGLGHMLRMGMAGHGEFRAREEEAAARQELVNAIRGIDPAQGPSMDQIATVMGRDPQMGASLYAGAMDARAAAAAQARDEANTLRARDWSVEDREDQQSAAAALADAKRERWSDIATPEGARPGQMFQREAGSGQVRAVGGGAPPVSGADRKALWQQQDEYINSSASIGKLRRASELLTEGIDIGPLSGARTWAGKAGLPGADATLAARTTEYNNIMNAEAITAMSQALAGATTNEEMARFVQIMNDPATPADVKNRELNAMLAKAQGFNELQAARIVELGGEVPKPPQAASTDAEAGIIQAAKDAIAQGADPELVRKRMVERGVDPRKLDEAP